MPSKFHKSEQGSAGTKLVVFLLIFFLVGNALYNYVPVAYQGENFKQELNTAVLQSVAIPVLGKTPVDVVKERILRAIKSNNLPPDTFLDVKQLNNVVQARVAYTVKVSILPFGLYTIDYKFDNTATPAGLMNKD